ncbi:iron-sulfur cluster insertion protein ErpA [Ancylobacter mangrovi]|uniref:Iron-sulfur cluster insertion protein ErpA n=1 Tax=Ancylobacter mangrovi TaxID=2972472 RepID=A0A9X2T270_9HYPH|nr:iron-sulfur cluster insertion protein ErpA [Ancylobacter mangrovi]MCS0495890.1 iron-sulfur cluster insertion protein ErpA [Ancylobacter mangrovi]MCS0504693.1 iron-sulfur cluster insertion protein ErpA [Ancylobacter mangrovi]
MSASTQGANASSPPVSPETAAPLSLSVGVTASAAKRIAEILSAEPAESMLRVSVEGGGCSGFQYKFDITREREADDVLIDERGARVVIDPVSLEYMSGSHIDFVDDLMGASFRIENPHATASCGCGTSFAL